MHTIGDLARLDREAAASILGRQGCTLHDYATGAEHSPVVPPGSSPAPNRWATASPFPAIWWDGRSSTPGVTELADEVAVRLRGHGLKCTTLQVTIRDPNFKDICRQKRLSAPTYVARELTETAMELIRAAWRENAPVRALTLTAQALVEEGEAGEQLDLFAAGAAPRPGPSWRSWKRPWTAYGTNSAGMPSLRPLPSTGTGPKSKRSSACPRWTEYLDAARQRRIHHDQSHLF